MCVCTRVFLCLYASEEGAGRRREGCVCWCAGFLVFVGGGGRGGGGGGGVCGGGGASMLLSVFVCVCMCVHARVHVCIA